MICSTVSRANKANHSREATRNKRNADNITLTDLVDYPFGETLDYPGEEIVSNEINEEIDDDSFPSPKFNQVKNNDGKHVRDERVDQSFSDGQDRMNKNDRNDVKKVLFELQRQGKELAEHIKQQGVIMQKMLDFMSHSSKFQRDGDADDSLIFQNEN